MPCIYPSSGHVNDPGDHLVRNGFVFRCSCGLVVFGGPSDMNQSFDSCVPLSGLCMQKPTDKLDYAVSIQCCSGSDTPAFLHSLFLAGLFC